ncbi:Hsp70 family protein [Synechococcus sp. M16CYN]|uniref:Hsp70 family protein n=1 Tax=Synechococcus sp. M16CYN TaxID=3103139 RepID=UPI003249BBE3
MGEKELRHPSERGGTLAIDLGSTTTVVAFQSPGDPTVQLLDLPPIGHRPGEIPSLVWDSHEQPLIGCQVLEAGLHDTDDPRLHRDFKLHIGNRNTPKHDRASWAGEQLLQQVWQRLPANLNIERLVLSAPVKSYRAYRSWLVKASETLPVKEVALVDEPTAAALGAGLPPGSRILVVDFGGSTIDLALVALEGGEGKAAPVAQLLRLGGKNLGEGSGQRLRTAKVLGKAGMRLGGRDIDRWIVNSCCPNQPITMTLLNSAERLKCRLSNIAISDREELLELAINGQQHSLRLSRRALDRLLDHHGFNVALSKLMEATLAGGRRHNCHLGDLEGIVVVGGGARLPWLRRWLIENTAPAPLLMPPPVEAVALGALKLTPGVAIRDVLRNGVSLRTWDQRSNRHRWHPLFVAGQSWPTSNSLDLVLAASRPGQDNIELVLAEPLPQEIHSVVFVNGLPCLRENEAGKGRHQLWPGDPLVLPLSPPGKTGEDCLHLRWAIDAKAQLQLSVRDLRSNEQYPTMLLGTVR